MDDTAKMDFKTIATRAKAWAETPGAKRLGRVARILFFVAMIAILLFQLRAIGWSDVIRALPTQPLFYILFFVNFMVLPLTEVPIFRLLLGQAIPGALPVLVRKRIVNAVLVDYSGDVYLYSWARTRLGIDARKLLLAVKDNAILSSLAGAMVAGAFIVTFIVRAPTGRIASWLDSSLGLVVGGVLCASLTLPLLLRFRHAILSTSSRVAWQVFGIHSLRTVINLAIQVVQWVIVLPGEHWTTWLSFLTAQLVIARLPFIPNRDLLFMAAGLQMSGALTVSRDAMAGLLVAGTALTQGTNLVLFLVTAFWMKPVPVPPGEEKVALH
ncbi:hypothetical protein COA17_04000 [Sphingomonas ginsenosidimutans]|jgi:hypothetical protein|uniref:Flippase-like domain-containing protein n=2 Tax=Sphingomonadaceae TaxID=41297 RepID=A0A2A4I2R8_9SPHN|nr:hypothetical protein [Sphingomonas ginsenosidimutans]PCG10571.1 hypothetical protein COA17_04000 [Sphingomonas ginsenosidimutans]